MTTLNTAPNLLQPDYFYEDLIGMHHGLTDAESSLINARLILLLANHIGDEQVLREAMVAAREEVTGSRHEHA